MQCAQPIFGLTTSIVMLVIVAILCRQPILKHNRYSELDSPGVLQLLYLAGVQNDVVMKLKEEVGTDKPCLKTLRAAGKKVRQWPLDAAEEGEQEKGA